MPKIKLSELCSRIGDGIHGTPNYIEDSSVYFINGNNLKSGKIVVNSETKRVSYKELSQNFIDLNENSLLISINGTLGNMAFYRGEQVLLGKSSAYLNFKENINVFYYYYFQLKSIQEYFYNVATGSTIKNLSLKSLKDFEVPFFEKEKSKNISKVLSDLDAKIEVNNQINKELEAMAKLVYDYWFVQFDFPDSNGKPYKSSGGKMLYNEVLKREIPDGWNLDLLGNELVTSLGGTPSTKRKDFWNNGEYHWLNSGEIANFPVIDSELKITKEAIQQSATDLLPKGSIVMSITRHIRPSILGIEACANQSVIGILENDIYKSSFIFPFIKNEVPRFMALRTGAQQPHINKGIVDSTQFLKPNPAVLANYYKITDSFYDKIVVNAKENQELAALRDWLLPMLMNGQVTVGEGYDIVKEQLGMVAEGDGKYG